MGTSERRFRRTFRQLPGSASAGVQVWMQLQMQVSPLKAGFH